MKSSVSITDEKILNGVVIPFKGSHKFSKLVNKLLFCYANDKAFRMMINNIDAKSLEQIRYCQRNRHLLDLQVLFSRAGHKTLESVNKAIADKPFILGDIIGTTEGFNFLHDELTTNILPIYKDKLADRLYLRFQYLRTLQEAAIFSGANEDRYKDYCSQIKSKGVVPLNVFIKIQLGLEDNEHYLRIYDDGVCTFFDDYMVEGFDTSYCITSDLQELISSRLGNIGIYIPSAKEICLKDFFSESGQFSLKNFLDSPLEIDSFDEEYIFCQSVVK